MVDVKCSYCGGSIDFNKALHREVKNGDFRKYLHYCGDHHYKLWQEQERQKQPPSPRDSTVAMGHLGAIESQLK